MKVGDTWLMKLRDSGQIVRVRLVSLYETAVEVEECSPLIGWSRPSIVDRNNVVFTARVGP
jgi:hypothetical protein